MKYNTTTKTEPRAGTDYIHELYIRWIPLVKHEPRLYHSPMRPMVQYKISWIVPRSPRDLPLDLLGLSDWMAGVNPGTLDRPWIFGSSQKEEPSNLVRVYLS